MKPDKWPFKPQHITNDGGKSTEGDLNKLTGVGIISNEYLQGIQTFICAKLGNPTTIVEFSPDGRPVRTDSTLLIYELHPPCRKFRACTKHRYCLDCDSAHAMLFRGLNRSNVETQIKNKIVKGSVQQYYPDPGTIPQFRFAKDLDRGYLEYDCPLLGYRELLFPIFFEDQVIAAFFTGQLCHEGKLDTIRARQSEFFKAKPCGREYEQYQTEHPEDSFDSLEGLVAAEHEKWIKDPSHILNNQRYQDLIRGVDRELSSLEVTLQDQMELQRDRFVRKHVEQRIQEFNENLPDRPSSDGDYLALLWTDLEARLRDLISDFAIKYAVVFGPKHLPMNDNPELLETVVHVGDLADDLASETGHLPKYDLSKVPKDVRGRAITSAIEETLFSSVQGLRVDLNQCSHRVRIFPVPFHAPSPTVILVGYHDWNPGTSVENQSEGYLETAIQSFYTVVCSALSSIFATMTQSNQETTLRVFGHELGQLTIGLDFLRLRYLSSAEKLRDLPVKKAEDIHRDIAGYLRQIHFLREQANWMTMSIREPKKTEFMAFREILFKWEDTYRLEARRKSLQFDILRPKGDDPERPPVYGDQQLLEQLLYNLVSNAIKYCHRGTKIYIDCKKMDGSVGSSHIMTITDYGIPIEEGKRLYGLGIRGRNVAGEEGLGIGLNMAERIANAHGGRMEHSCEWISEFNVPLIESYLEFQFAQKSLIPSLRDELDRLKQTNQYSTIVAKYEDGRLRYSNPSPLELIYSTKKPTYRVTFTVTIPAKEARR